MINMRENKFDVEGMKKKIRNFLRMQISKRPELVERWNEIMNSNVEDHDDYGDLAHIEKIFRDYRDFHNKAMGIEYEPDINQFIFYIPLRLNNIYEDWGVRDEIAKEITEDGKKYFGTDSFECYWSRINASDNSFFCKVRFGNTYLTPKRKVNQILQTLLKEYGQEVTSYESYKEVWNDETKKYDKHIPVICHVFDKPSYAGPSPKVVWWDIEQSKGYDGKLQNKYTGYFHCNDSRYYLEVDENTIVNKVIKEIHERMAEDANRGE